MVGCSSFLDQKAPDQETSGNYWRNIENAESGLSAAYSQVASCTGAWSMGEYKYVVEAFREDITDMGPDAYNYPAWVQLYDFTYEFGNINLRVYWEDNYRGAMYANQVVDKVPGIEVAEADKAYRDQLVAEAQFLRGYYHFQLLMNWERIKVVDLYATSESEINKPLSERDVCWDFVIGCFEESLEGGRLPAKHPNDNAGRVTSGAANAYLGLAYLTRAYEQGGATSPDRGDLAKAESALKKVTGYELAESYASLFDGRAQNSPETIFELQQSDNTAGGAYYKHTFHRFVGTRYTLGWGCIEPSEMLYDAFTKEGEVSTAGRYDQRMYEVLHFDDNYYRDNPDAVFGLGYDAVYPTEADFEPGAAPKLYWYRKFLPYDLDDLYIEYAGRNVPLMRYSNVLLLLAEALNEQGKTSEAIPLINQVRERALMPAMAGSSQDAVRAQIEHERIIEFPLENFRFYDMRRWGVDEKRLHATGRINYKRSEHAFFPVPQIEIQSNSVIRDQLKEEGKQK